MKVGRIRVDGYRLLNNFSMDMRDNLSLVIGKNNTGKTSLLNVLSSFLQSQSPEFSYEDFSIELQMDLQKSLISDAADYPTYPPRIGLELEIQYDDKDNLRNLSHLMVDLSPDSRTVHLRFLNEVTIESFARLHGDARRNIEAIEQAINKKLTKEEKQEENQRFLSKKIRGYLSTSIESYDPEDHLNTISLTKEAGLIRKVVRFEFVSARRSVENRKAGKNGKSAGRALSQLSSDYFDHTGKAQDNRLFRIESVVSAAV